MLPFVSSLVRQKTTLLHILHLGHYLNCTVFVYLEVTVSHSFCSSHSQTNHWRHYHKSKQKKCKLLLGACNPPRHLMSMSRHLLHSRNNLLTFFIHLNMKWMCIFVTMLPWQTNFWLLTRRNKFSRPVISLVGQHEEKTLCFSVQLLFFH
jgi:hypothetical protein